MMIVMSYDFEEKRLIEEIKNRKPKIVLLQLPEGLKPEAPRLALIVEKAGALSIISSDPCYGACDLAISEAKLLGADLIVHYGHSPMILELDVPVVYIEVKANLGIKEAIMKTLPYLQSWNKIGLITTVQHIYQIDESKKLLEDAGKTVFVGNVGNFKYSGQVLGCDFSNALVISKSVEAYVFIGGGRFHAIGVTLATGKPTIIADPYDQMAYSIHDQVRRIIMQRWGNISKAKDARSIGILVSLKPGQMKLSRAIELKKKFEQNKMAVILFAVREITPNVLIQFPGIDAFVNTACVRLSLDDSPNFDKPILSINEALVLLGEMKWEALLKDGWFEKAI
jgi:2-(3-amino-3-carboxypropyl)histidine synthase